jgi:energy-coupling factor transport system ATP-binding protein
VIVVEGLGFTYPDGTRAIVGVDLRIRHGERIAIVGQNGSGKTTLVRHFNGLLRATQGSVRVDGTPVGSRHVAELARTVGLAFQNPDRQVFARSVDAEVRFGARNLGVRGTALDDRCSHALEQVGLDGHERENPYDLGLSRRKLLTVASVLAMGTPVVVLDEPTTGQDARGVERVASIVSELGRTGRTVIAISHDMHFAAEHFERVVVMRAGQIVLDGTPETVFAEQAWPVLASTYLEAPYAAKVGARLGLGSTPSDALLMARLKERQPAGTHGASV